APATGSTIAQMKRRSVAPAVQGGAPAAAAAPDVKAESAPREEAQRVAKDAAAAPAPAQLAAPPPAAATSQAAAPPQAKASFVTDSARGRSFSTWGASK